jgi:hypothetical protein
MRKINFLICISIILIVFTDFGLSSCKKNKASETGELIGNWISTDLVDTISFTSDLYLYKMFYGIKDRYTYSVNQDSLKIEYSGNLMPYIYIGPSKYHHFELNGNQLTIDFRPPYYGLRPIVVTFIRK